MIQHSYFLLGIYTILWCFFHSVLISKSITEFCKINFGTFFKFYRILYNILSTFTFLFLIWYTRSIKEQLLFNWESGYEFVRALLITIALLLLFAGAKSYDMLSFSGIRQVKQNTTQLTLSKKGKILTNGILGIIRHPWYTATFLIIWSRNIYISTLITNFILSFYLLIGCYLEEKKLILEFGAEYQDYQKNVSKFTPWKWFKNK
ncbi:methyltransferase family protein [Ancylomarina longa]|uniref:NnrU domain-containing protein n=1 Tax=Ancylomarina longa TaxID=2487017 RepID=A0A434AXJ2_9BACT|nr:NnrU family protein [Ancylomarina longa]RUT79157.1 hypothetical protein DLK05_04890 [Ancylomarina longa]